MPRYKAAIAANHAASYLYQIPYRLGIAFRTSEDTKNIMT